MVPESREQHSSRGTHHVLLEAASGLRDNRKLFSLDIGNAFVLEVQPVMLQLLAVLSALILETLD